MKGVILGLVMMFTMIGCCSTKSIQYIPVQGETITEYRDTTIYLEKVIEVPVPVERVVEVVPELDTSRLETSIAYSEAFLDTESKKLRHTLRNKETALKGKLDTIVRVEYVNKYIEKEVIKEVPVEVPYIPKFAWACIIFTACWSVLKIAKIIWKFKGL